VAKIHGAKKALNKLHFRKHLTNPSFAKETRKIKVDPKAAPEKLVQLSRKFWRVDSNNALDLNSGTIKEFSIVATDHIVRMIFPKLKQSVRMYARRFIEDEFGIFKRVWNDALLFNKGGQDITHKCKEVVRINALEIKDGYSTTYKMDVNREPDRYYGLRGVTEAQISDMRNRIDDIYYGHILTVIEKGSCDYIFNAASTCRIVDPSADIDHPSKMKRGPAFFDLDKTMKRADEENNSLGAWWDYSLNLVLVVAVLYLVLKVVSEATRYYESYKRGILIEEKRSARTEHLKQLLKKAIAEEEKRAEEADNNQRRAGGGARSSGPTAEEIAEAERDDELYRQLQEKEAAPTFVSRVVNTVEAPVRQGFRVVKSMVTNTMVERRQVDLRGTGLVWEVPKHYLGEREEGTTNIRATNITTVTIGNVTYNIYCLPREKIRGANSCDDERLDNLLSIAKDGKVTAGQRGNTLHPYNTGRFDFMTVKSSGSPVRLYNSNRPIIMRVRGVDQKLYILDTVDDIGH